MIEKLQRAMGETTAGSITIYEHADLWNEIMAAKPCPFQHFLRGGIVVDETGDQWRKDAGNNLYLKFKGCHEWESTETYEVLFKLFMKQVVEIAVTPPVAVGSRVHFADEEISGVGQASNVRNGYATVHFNGWSKDFLVTELEVVS